MRPLVAISVGCPSGIGPEVAVAAAARSKEATSILVGDRWVIERAAKVVGVSRRRLRDVEPATAAELGRGAIGVLGSASHVDERDARFGRPTAKSGGAQLAWIDQATDLVTAGVAGALVTGPVSKHAIAAWGEASRGPARKFRGHTEHLAERLGAREVVMAFWAERLVISLVTTHLPLGKVPRAVTPAAVGASVFFTADLARRLGKRRPRIAVCGLNPHAGEQGLLGVEETDRIGPGIAEGKKRLARARLAAVLEGPIGAETAIRKAYSGSYDAVVAMYHDQATIPMKLVGFGDAVNVTLGLPIVRTSVDHGTGYDIAGTGRADARGMASAIELAVRLAKSRFAKTS